MDLLAVSIAALLVCAVFAWVAWDQREARREQARESVRERQAFTGERSVWSAERAELLERLTVALRRPSPTMGTWGGVEVPAPDPLEHGQGDRIVVQAEDAFLDGIEELSVNGTHGWTG